MKRIDQLNQTDIEYHLRSAVDSLVPDVFDKINLDAPQEAAEPERKIAAIRRWGRTASTAAAACLVAVSYTHLDVYKRQVSDGYNGGSVIY